MPVTPSRPKGPPLNALRAFEAAARLGGFSKAAEELCVTPGAVTQHIKALEDWVGASLFERRSQGVRLTRAGARLQPEFTAAFDRLGEAVHRLRDVTDTPVVHIAALPSVAQLWLSSRLPRLRAENPSCLFSVTALESPPNLLRDMFDWSLFFEPLSKASDGIVIETDVVFPVCTPEIAASIRSINDLEPHMLLMDDTWAEDWDTWSAEEGFTLSTTQRNVRFSLFALALEECRNGAGILMGHEALVRRDLDAGRLVAPFETKATTGLALTLRSTQSRRKMADSFVTFE